MLLTKINHKIYFVPNYNKINFRFASVRSTYVDKNNLVVNTQKTVY